MWPWQWVVITEHKWQLPLVKVKLVMYTGDGWYHVRVYHKWFFKWILQRDFIYRTEIEAKKEQIKLLLKFTELGNVIN